MFYLLAFLIVCFVVFGAFWILNKREDEKNTQQKLADKGASAMVTLPHTAGLPIAEGGPCDLFYCAEHIEINGNGVQFILNFSQIHDICVKTSTEIHSQYVSSAAGAVGGAMLFGALGALIFGRVKQKQITNTRYYLIFTYSSNGKVDYIAFEAAHQNRHVKYFVDEFNKRPKNVRAVAL